MTEQIQLSSNEGAKELSFVPSYHAPNNEGKWQLSKQLHVGKSSTQLIAALEEACLIRAEGGEVDLSINPMEMPPSNSLSFVFAQEPVEFYFRDVGSLPTGMNWVNAWLAKHKVGNRLPRGKAFEAHRHLESEAGSLTLGKLITGSIKTALNFG